MRITNRTAFTILMISGFVLLILGVIYGGLAAETIKDKKVPCYDKFNNKIIGQLCMESAKTELSDEGVVICFFGILLCLIGFFINLNE